jgi:ubiquinone/menaquinone biosynthesis C-methylase UbiE
MNRREWLAKRRAAVEQDYTRDAPTYDHGYDPVTPVHRQFVARLIETCPEGGTILDAACGTGPYLGMVLEAGRDVVGTDQSSGMLAQARAKHPVLRLEQVGLQELVFEGEFNAAMCIDAMEHVPPENWPRVIANLRKGLRSGGHLYLPSRRSTGENSTAPSGKRERPACPLSMARTSAKRWADTTTTRIESRSGAGSPRRASWLWTGSTNGSVATAITTC